MQQPNGLPRIFDETTAQVYCDPDPDDSAVAVDGWQVFLFHYKDEWRICTAHDVEAEAIAELFWQVWKSQQCEYPEDRARTYTLWLVSPQRYRFLVKYEREAILWEAPTLEPDASPFVSPGSLEFAATEAGLGYMADGYGPFNMRAENFNEQMLWSLQRKRQLARFLEQVPHAREYAERVLGDTYERLVETYEEAWTEVQPLVGDRKAFARALQAINLVYRVFWTLREDPTMSPADYFDWCVESDKEWRKIFRQFRSSRKNRSNG